MFSAIRKRFAYANVAMTLALVFAMTGGAYGAGHYLITSTKQISPKVLKALKGANGKNGVAGTAGPAGATGAAGAVGAKGENGTNGGQGIQGPAGPTGPQGPEGSFDTTLPKGKTLKGDWSLLGFEQAGGTEGLVASSVSFGIPLAAAPEPIYVTKADWAEEELEINGVKVKEKDPAGCTGTVGSPGAADGKLCIFVYEEEGMVTHGVEEQQAGVEICANGGKESMLYCALGASGSYEPSADPFGFSVVGVAKERDLVNASGTWAVTAG